MIPIIDHNGNYYTLNGEPIFEKRALAEFGANVADWTLIAYKKITELIPTHKIDPDYKDDYQFIPVEPILLQNLNEESENDRFILSLFDQNDKRIIVVSEANLPSGGNYLDDAYTSLYSRNFDSWKTLDLLMIVRQAHRENTANNRFKLPYNPSKEEIEQYIEDSRKADSQHHGHPTF